MATEYFTSDSWGDRVIIQRGNNDANVVIDSDVLIGSSNTDAIVLTASFHDVLVRGTVSGYGNAIRLGDAPGADYANTLRVARDGLVEGGIVGAAFSGLGTLVNDGTIFGNDYGVTFNLGSGGRVDMTNRGTISGGKDGIWVHSTQDVRVALSNYGTIEGLNAYRGFEHRDLIVNRGVMRGAVVLHEGDDRFDNRGGIVEDGKVNGGGGNDTFLAGDSEDVFLGGDGIDVLDFRSSNGLRVSLADDSGTGVATGDDYFGFEVVLGSRGGNDTLIGNWASNTLSGFGGTDDLRGADGADLLRGGIEADRLSGGGRATTPSASSPSTTAATRSAISARFQETTISSTSTPRTSASPSARQRPCRPAASRSGRTTRRRTPTTASSSAPPTRRSGSTPTAAVPVRRCSSRTFRTLRRTSRRPISCSWSEAPLRRARRSRKGSGDPPRWP